MHVYVYIYILVTIKDKRSSSENKPRYLSVQQRIRKDCSVVNKRKRS